MSISRNTSPAAFAIGFFVIGITNGLGLLSKGQFGLQYVLTWELVDCCSGLLASLILIVAYPRLQRTLTGWQLLLSAALLCCGCGVFWRLVSNHSMWLLGMVRQPGISPTVLLIRGGLMDGTTLGLLSSVYFGIAHWRQAAEQREKARQAIALAHQAQLQMLRYQLNPHFLFNALNSIRGMIVEDPARSREMVTELADFLRYSLDGDERGGTIGDEIRAIESYLAIQRIRFVEQLDAEVQVEDSTPSVAVPCFLIHPLVENAIKYGMKTSAMPLRIRIRVDRAGDTIVILVANTGRLLEASGNGREGDRQSTGIGLRNVRERLHLVFPGRHSFKIWESDGWVRAEMQLRQAGQGVPNDISYSSDRG